MTLGRKMNITDIETYFTDSSDEQILHAFERAIAGARKDNVPFVPRIEAQEIDGRTRVEICVDKGTTIV